MAPGRVKGTTSDFDRVAVIIVTIIIRGEEERGAEGGRRGEGEGWGGRKGGGGEVGERTGGGAGNQTPDQGPQNGLIF